MEAQVLDLRRPRINRVGYDKEENATHVAIANLVESGLNEEKSWTPDQHPARHVHALISFGRVSVMF